MGLAAAAGGALVHVVVATTDGPPTAAHDDTTHPKMTIKHHDRAYRAGAPVAAAAAMMMALSSSASSSSPSWIPPLMSPFPSLLLVAPLRPHRSSMSRSSQPTRSSASGPPAPASRTCPCPSRAGGPPRRSRPPADTPAKDTPRSRQGKMGSRGGGEARRCDTWGSREASHSAAVKLCRRYEGKERPGSGMAPRRLARLRVVSHAPLRLLEPAHTIHPQRTTQHNATYNTNLTTQHTTQRRRALERVRLPVPVVLVVIHVIKALCLIFRRPNRAVARRRRGRGLRQRAEGIGHFTDVRAEKGGAEQASRVSCCFVLFRFVFAPPPLCAPRQPLWAERPRPRPCRRPRRPWPRPAAAGSAAGRETARTPAERVGS